MSRRLLLALAVLALPLCSASGQRLFRSTTPVEITLTTNLKALLKDRDSTKFVPHGALLTYKDDDGQAVSIAITLRTRGHFRRQARNCEFPPLLLQFKKKAANKTLLQGNTRLKLTTNCKPKNNDYEQYVLQEYAVYRLYERLSPVHFRTRLVHVSYIDSTSAIPTVTGWAFLVEDDKEIAKQESLSPEKAKGAYFDDLEPTQLAITSLFEYMVGNTDWSVSGLHNIALMRESAGSVKAVAYDFDWTGVVNPRYAFPDARLGIKTITERLYRGPCLTPAQWQPIFDRFNSARPAVDSIYKGIPSLDARIVKASVAWYDDFFKTISDARAAKRALIEGCQPKGN
ncbi:MAG: hypothetical protein M3Y64_01035 [Gemmatimonadota bacterium]|nr:hypothetical protein [Gemmatimonadota bacterium]